MEGRADRSWLGTNRVKIALGIAIFEGILGEKTFQQVTEEFAEIVIPKVWQREGKKVSKVSSRLSICRLREANCLRMVVFTRNPFRVDLRSCCLLSDDAEIQGISSFFRNSTCRNPTGSLG